MRELHASPFGSNGITPDGGVDFSGYHVDVWLLHSLIWPTEFSRSLLTSVGPCCSPETCNGQMFY